MDEQHALQAIRQQIDNIDLTIQDLLNKRVALAQKVAEIKMANGENSDFYRPDREAIVLREVIKRNNGPLADKEMARLFREIMSVCLAAEKPLNIAYLGPPASFTEAAALKQFGGAVRLQSLATIDDVFAAVSAGTANYGVVPIENSTEGMVSHTLDKLASCSLKINGEISLRIHHCLLSNEQDLSTITNIYAHPQALAQCRHWLAANLPDCQLNSVQSNSEAAKIVAKQANSAAIAADRAAQLYQLTILASHIEDHANNTTRFIVIGMQDIEATGVDKTSLLVSTKNEPGALQTLLKPLADHAISMSRIESRPSRQQVWEYIFFIDIEGHCQDKAVAAALATLAQDSAMCRVLGSYPKAVL